VGLFPTISTAFLTTWPIITASLSMVFPNGYEGEQFLVSAERQFNQDLFSDAELDVLEKVAAHFRDTSTTDIIAYSHREKAWTENEKDKSINSYKDYAFELSGI
jgi:hypothetical protein